MAFGSGGARDFLRDCGVKACAEPFLELFFHATIFAGVEG